MQLRRRVNNTRSSGKRRARGEFSKPYALGQTAPRLAPVPSFRKKVDYQLKYFFLHSTSTSVVSNWSDVFSLSGVTNYAKYTAMWDEYKINRIEVNIVPPQQSASEVGVFISSVDANDNNVIPIADLEAMNNSIETSVLTPHYHCWQPLVLTGTLSMNGWISCTNPTQIWYGLKSCAGVTSAVEQLTYFVTLHISFRGQNA
jgi:hypothetical protein